MTEIRTNTNKWLVKTEKNKKGIVGKLILTAILLIIGILNIYPFLFMLSSSFKPLNQMFEYPIQLIPRTFILQNYKNLFLPEYYFTRWYANTLTMITLTVALKTFIVSMTAYAFARLRFKGRDIIFLVFLAAMMMPPDVTIIPKYVIFKFINITDTMWSLILPSTFDVFFVFMLRQFFITIPMSLSEAAIIDGCSHFKVFYKIILPLTKPAMITMTIFTFVWGWNDYMNPYIFISDTRKQMLTVGIKLFTTSMASDYTTQMAAATLVLIPVLILFLFAQKFFIEGITTSGVKG
ncbi:carbohydrate ABC transporter permease [Vallitalea okinawensis]|uniref:carbohydrate ABC transporter permease n=1 Tax=Vallitalea okinawensis TaxID=2078660 RepID=UPI000CFB723A|nr:carbohydrate ABC transporter permease [Vallitalea okinawensis]